MALQTALILPDICGALQDDGEASGEKYRNWVRDNFCIKNIYIKPDEMYRLRCAVLHQNRSTHEKIKYNQIIFTTPECNVHVHACHLGDALSLDIESFCNEMIESVESWLKEYAADTNFLQNEKLCLKLHPNGILPYISGVPVYGIEECC